MDSPTTLAGPIQPAPSGQPRLSREALRLAAYTSKIQIDTTERATSSASPALNGDSQIPVAPMTMDQVRKRSLPPGDFLAMTGKGWGGNRPIYQVHLLSYR